MGAGRKWAQGGNEGGNEAENGLCRLRGSEMFRVILGTSGAGTCPVQGEATGHNGSGRRIYFGERGKKMSKIRDYSSAA